jgi:hypothetical protein
MKVRQGSDYEVTFSASHPDTGAPLNLTSGYSVLGKVGKTQYSEAPWLYEWNQGAGNVQLLNGSLKLKIPGAHSKVWAFERVFYSAKVINTVSLEEVVLAYGPLTIFRTLD